MPALSEKFRIYIDRNLSPAARSARLAAFAKARLAELIASGRASEDYVRLVDGMAGRVESQVRGDGGGRIEYNFVYLGPAVVRALEFLRGRAPVGDEVNRPDNRKFRDSFFVGVNGRFIRAAEFRPEMVPASATEVSIGNSAPDNRRADEQSKMTGDKTIDYSVPAAMYVDTARMLRRAYPTLKAKRVYSIRFTGQYILRGGKAAERPTQSPALIISTR